MSYYLLTTHSFFILYNIKLSISVITTNIAEHTIVVFTQKLLVIIPANVGIISAETPV